MNVKALSRGDLTLRGEARTPRLTVVGPVVLALCAVVLWAVSLPEIQVGQITDLGLIAALPIPFFLSLAVLTASFCLTLGPESWRRPLLLLHVVVLIVMIFGVPILVEELPRFHSLWKHLGVAEYIQRTGHVNPLIDAYFNWPGFFILFAFIADVGGLQNWPALVAWTPVVLNLLYLGPLLMIFSAATDDKRLVWLGVWLFYITNWIGQDYFSPQGFNYFLSLVIVGILVRWFKVPAGQPHPVLKRLRVFERTARLPARLRDLLTPTDTPSAPSQRWQRWGLLAILLTIFGFVVASHQLTPFAIFGGVTALVVCNRCSVRWLPIVMLVVTVLWIRYMSEAYIAGHGDKLASNIGDIDQAVNANAASRFGGSQGHMIVVYARSIMTVALWGLALLGGIRRLRHGHRDLTYALLAAAPFPLLVLQPYGGEMALRVYLFALPFMAFFAAALFFPTPAIGTSWRTTAVIGVLSLALLGAFFVTRYGNEKMDYATREEAAAAAYLYDIAPPGSLLLVGTTNTVLKYQDYEKYRYRSLTNVLEWRNGPIEQNVEAVARLMDNARFPATYLLITRSQIANDELFFLFPAPLAELTQALSESERFRIVYANDNAQIFTLVQTPADAGT